MVVPSSYAKAFIMFAMARRLLQTRAEVTWRKLFVMGLALLTFAMATVPAGLAMKGLFLALVFFACALSTWFVILYPDERMLVVKWCSRKSTRKRSLTWNKA
jgi:hypothetical protein